MSLGYREQFVEEIIFTRFFFNLSKTYDSIHRRVLLSLMEKYSVGLNILRYVRNIWKTKSSSLNRGVVQCREKSTEGSYTW